MRVSRVAVSSLAAYGLDYNASGVKTSNSRMGRRFAKKPAFLHKYTMPTTLRTTMTTRRPGAIVGALLGCALSMVGACQGYPFELRVPQSATGSNIEQLVATLTPTDILFVIDDSGSMLDERTELANNIGTFITQLSETSGDFHVGIVTTDVECNIPERDCTSPTSATSLSCCRLVNAGPLPTCQELDTNGDGEIDWSSCDGGRLRAPKGKSAYWTSPTAAQRATWAADFSSTILDLGCNGSGLESGLEAARRAVNCSVFGYDASQPNRCPSAAMAQLNAGFVRPDADLVVIFVSDEDDCSFMDPNVYFAPRFHECRRPSCTSVRPHGVLCVLRQGGLRHWHPAGVE